MRLTKLKLAGFKSFVDPTTVEFPSELTGIVGPNGCGKSNTIDAVRWVMGESSAKHLRGDSMADVIFNGSTSRKPVGQASVELVFDNTDGTAGGQYANYNEISVKRTVSRDGQSSYFLNGTRCRRRDITDIFLGTGLGPRSYAIIEQGTISRIIEARPEELRVFLEEAAGISKYKERRRETENRIRHTRENLDRLNDLRDELDKQLTRLQRQARTAERYKVLKEEERLMRAQLTALRWQVKNNESAEYESRIREHENQLESGVARQRNIEAEIEKQRETHTEASDAFNEVQSRFYSVGADIARLEQSIQHAKERRQQQQQDLNQLEQDWQEARNHYDSDLRRLEEQKAQLVDVEPRMQALAEHEQTSAQSLAEAESAQHDWQAEWESFNQDAAEPARQAEVQRSRIQQYENQLQRQQERLERLSDEIQKQGPNQLNGEISQLEENLAQTEARIEQEQQQLETCQQQIGTLRDQIHDLNGRLDESRGKSQDLRGRVASLEALQQAALGKDEGAVTQWLNSQHLADASRLAEELDVENGWEKAAECVLGEYLEAVCVDGIDPLTAVLNDFEEGTLTLFDTRAASGASSAAGERLSGKVKAPWSLDNLLGDVLVAEDLSAALGMREQLADNESVVTRDGLWLGRNWLRVARDRDEKAGILQREQALKQMAAEMEQLQAESQQQQQILDESREQLRTAEMDRDGHQATVNQQSRQRADIQSDLSARRARLEQMQTRQAEQQRELQEVQEHVEKDNQLLAEARQALESALEQMASFETQRNELQERREVISARLSEVREKARADREAAHDVRVRIETLRAEISSLEQSLQRMQDRQSQLSERREELKASIDESESPILEMSQELEGMLAKRVEVENELKQARAGMENIEHTMRELEEARVQAEQQVQDIRSQLENVRIGWQELKVRRQTLEEKVIESGFDLKQLLEEMPESANEDEWANNVEELDRKIQRLGPINLAAIEEYEQQSERKEYLDAQNNDLTEALTTLENAIQKIDRESRTRFQETFDKVNSGMKDLFPRLFGGGHAYLEMTGDDLLDTGVTVMARPPGKRNSTIHLLSGGEKALTAVALVFSIFQLNPAPFCMLDEVDAPLDDANVGRFCDMVKHMSEKTQFIFITHNKVTMEISKHLTGVTMHEPGVSRLVAVDVDEAAKLATG